jgi:hypothetical protein
MMRRQLVGICSLVLLAAAPAQAQDEGAVAEALFREARELMNEARYDEACPKFAESQRLDPAAGTLLNLAVCHEAQGKTASAWAEFKEALAQARAANRHDRIELATEHIEALEPRLSRLTVEVDGEPVDDLEVTINDTGLGAAAWGTAVPVDPGEIAVRAAAPGRTPFEETIQVGEGETVRVTIPQLEDGGVEPSDDPQDGTETRDDSVTPAYVVGGVGVAVVGVGAYFGVRALQERSVADDQGCRSVCVTEKGRQADKDAVFLGWVSSGALAVGLGALGVATYLYLDADGAQEPEAVGPRYLLLPSAGPRGAQLSFSATF